MRRHQWILFIALVGMTFTIVACEYTQDIIYTEPSEEVVTDPETETETTETEMETTETTETEMETTETEMETSETETETETETTKPETS